MQLVQLMRPVILQNRHGTRHDEKPNPVCAAIMIAVDYVSTGVFVVVEAVIARIRHHIKCAGGSRLLILKASLRQCRSVLRVDYSTN